MRINDSKLPLSKLFTQKRLEERKFPDVFPLSPFCQRPRMLSLFFFVYGSVFAEVPHARVRKLKERVAREWQRKQQQDTVCSVEKRTTRRTEDEGRKR